LWSFAPLPRCGFISARIRLKERSMVKWGLGSPNDPKALLLVYEQSQWNAWAAVAPGFAALFAHLGRIASQQYFAWACSPPHAAAKPSILRLPRDPEHGPRNPSFGDFLLTLRPRFLLLRASGRYLDDV
jgi:hypothetical protein